MYIKEKYINLLQEILYKTCSQIHGFFFDFPIKHYHWQLNSAKDVRLVSEKQKLPASLKRLQKTIYKTLITLIFQVIFELLLSQMWKE